MSSRSRSRQFAVQLIYQSEYSSKGLEDQFEGFWNQQGESTVNREFAEALALGVLDKREELDLELSGYLDKWSMDRIIPLNRIILEIGLYELKYHGAETPWKVAIDEAVMLARSFSGEEHTNFVNGVLHNWHLNNEAAT